MTSSQPAPERDGGYPSQLVPVALLVCVVIVGLLGAITRPRWTGPLHAQATIVGIVLEAALGALLIATFQRREGTETAQRLRTGLRYLLAIAMVALFVFLLVNAHLKLDQPTHLPIHNPVSPLKPANNPSLKPNLGSGGFPAWPLWAGAILVLVAAIAVALWLALRRKPNARIPVRGGMAIDPEDLKTALDEGAAALRAADYDDARKAIIACYVAMESRLGDKNDADTPDELLARATSAGLIHGPAAGRLTGLFYEARFSSHPLESDKRDAALQALDELRGQT
ncbi:MAG: DUF4129 domain-containing protein [Streptosporangiaceae bacterium]|jgi:hypothetical protein